jgi:phosphoribosylaminoimidazole (AIR) synthetase
MGIGMLVVIPAASVEETLATVGEDAHLVGRIEARKDEAVVLA